MEKSALVYIILTAVTVAFGFLVKNRDYTTEYLSGRRSFRGNTSGDLMAAGPDRQQACNAVAEFAIFCLLAGVSACRIAVGGDYWVYWLKFQLIDQGRHVSGEIFPSDFRRGILSSDLWLFFPDYGLLFPEGTA